MTSDEALRVLIVELLLVSSLGRLSLGLGGGEEPDCGLLQIGLVRNLRFCGNRL